jgi:AAHS family 3-hydroxyphenylpropionic acid transporter
MTETRFARGGVGAAAWTLPLCFVAALAEGYDIQSMGVAAPRLAPALGLVRDHLGPVFSASTLGLFAGALLMGRVADRFGRKWTLILSLTVFGLFSLATAFAWDLRSLLVIRVLAGLGLGGAMPNFVALAAEAVPPGRRAQIVTLLSSGMPLGGALASAYAASAGWREIFIVGGLAPLVVSPVMALRLPESQGFLEARIEPAAGRAGFAYALLARGRVATTLLLWAASFASLLTLYLLLNWLPTLMEAKGVSKPEASLVSMLFNIGGVMGAWALAAMLQRDRRIWAICIWYGGVAASLLFLAEASGRLASAGAAGFMAGVFVSAVPLSLYGLAPGHYPLLARATGVGAMMAVGRLGAVIGPLLAADLLAAGLGADGVLLAMLPLALIAGAASVAVVRRPSIVE